MIKQILIRVSFALAAIVAVVASSVTVGASSWNNIHPLKSRRADVEAILGKPAGGSEDGSTLNFKVMGGSVKIIFVDANYVKSKKLAQSIVGTVRQVVLQHENSSDTPESMGLLTNKEFKSDGSGETFVFRNEKQGIAYTFIGGRLRTSYYNPSSEQWAKAYR